MKSFAHLGRALAAAAVAAAFAVTLFGTPSCAPTTSASAAPRRQVEQLLAHGEFPAALALARENRLRDSAEPMAALQVARAYQGLGRMADEAAAWEQYLRLAPPTGDLCLRLSEVYAALSQPAQVVAIADRCLALDGRQVELLGDLAAASIALHDHPAAVSALRRALAIDPDHPQLNAMLRTLEAPAP